MLTALNIDQALDARDAFAKALYSSLFTWLVARINHIVYKGTKKTTAISILDIFGFEDFKVRLKINVFIDQNLLIEIIFDFRKIVSNNYVLTTPMKIYKCTSTNTYLN